MRERLKLIEARIVKLEKALTEDLGEVAEEAPAIKVENAKNV